MTVLHGVYKNFNFTEGEVIDGQVAGEALWMQGDRVLLCAPLLMLVKLGDTPSGTLSKLRKIVLWCNQQFEQVNEMTQDDGDNLESDMHDCWAARMPEFMSPVADVAGIRARSTLGERMHRCRHGNHGEFLEHCKKYAARVMALVRKQSNGPALVQQSSG